MLDAFWLRSMPTLAAYLNRDETAMKTLPQAPMGHPDGVGVKG
jgi:hypothetical protein